jgi:broad specificity phosphatase PhoE
VATTLTVEIVQHAEKQRSPGDPGLTVLGVQQALATARWMGSGERASAVWSSPMRRAMETASPIAEKFGVALRIDPRLRERMNWDDPRVESIEDFLDEWRATSRDRSYLPRNGDSSRQAASRFLAVLAEIAADCSAGRAIVVTHGGVTTDLLRDLLGDAGLRSRSPSLIEEGVPCCGVTTLQAVAGGWAAKSIAVCDHLSDWSGHRPA